jgi:hypothetical protein
MAGDLAARMFQPPRVSRSRRSLNCSQWPVRRRRLTRCSSR